MASRGSSEKSEGGLLSRSWRKGVCWQGWATTSSAMTGEMRLGISWEGQSRAGSRKGEQAAVHYAAAAGKVFPLVAQGFAARCQVPQRGARLSAGGSAESPAPPSLCRCVVDLQPCTRMGRIEDWSRHGTQLGTLCIRRPSRRGQGVGRVSVYI